MRAIVIAGTVATKAVSLATDLFRLDEEWLLMRQIVEENLKRIGADTVFEKFVGDVFLVAIGGNEEAVVSLVRWLQKIQSRTQKHGNGTTWHLGVDTVQWVYSPTANPEKFASEAMKLCDLAKARDKFVAFSPELSPAVIPVLEKHDFAVLGDAIFLEA